MTNLLKVVIETPYSGATPEETEKNIHFARSCIHDSLRRGELPFASHLLYTQPGILDDKDPEERKMGINAGLEMTENFDRTAVYLNRGTSRGMEWGIARANELKRQIEYRTLPDNWEEEYQKRVESCKDHNSSF